MGFPLDALTAWGLMNIVTLFITVIFCVGEDSVIFVPMWRAVWSVIPLGYAWWWIFAIDRTDVLHRWHRFWECRDLYFGYWDEFDITRCDDEG